MALAEEHGIDVDHRQIRTDLHPDAVLPQDLTSTLDSSSYDIADIVGSGIRDYGARLESRHVEQVGDEAVQAI